MKAIEAESGRVDELVPTIVSVSKLIFLEVGGENLASTYSIDSLGLRWTKSLRVY